MFLRFYLVLLLLWMTPTPLHTLLNGAAAQGTIVDTIAIPVLDLSTTNANSLNDFVGSSSEAQEYVNSATASSTTSGPANGILYYYLVHLQTMTADT